MSSPPRPPRPAVRAACVVVVAPEVVARILARHGEGESVAELGRGFGMTPAEVRGVIGATSSVEPGR
jgi:hypothetical protein